MANFMDLKIPKPKSVNKHFFSLYPSIKSETDFFLENLSLMIDANIPLGQALETLKNQVINPKFKKNITDIQDDVGNGLHLWEAFEKTKLLPSYTLSLIRIGEESGKLVENLKVANQQQQNDTILRARIKSALLYPSFVTFLMLVIGSGIAWFILPRLSAVFLNLKLNLPLPTKLLISLGQFLQNYGLFVIPLFFIILISLVYFLFFYKKTKSIGQKILFVIPGIKLLIQQVEIARFGYMLSTMLNTGVPIVESVGLLEEVSDFVQYKKFYKYLKFSLSEGDSFKNIFYSYPNSISLIPGHIQEMIIASQQSGKLQEVFLKLSKIYEEKSAESSKNLSIMLEPILLVVVWFGVVGVALSVVLPLYQLVGGLQSSTSGETSSNISNIPNKPVKYNIEETIPKVKGVNTATELGEELDSVEQSFLNNYFYIKILPEAEPYLKVRKQPNIQSEIVTKIYPGEVYVVKNVSNEWYEIILEDNISGWINKLYVSELN
jgi:type IV pilus assembly protein PilC